MLRNLRQGTLPLHSRLRCNLNNFMSWFFITFSTFCLPLRGQQAQAHYEAMSESAFLSPPSTIECHEIISNSWHLPVYIILIPITVMNTILRLSFDKSFFFLTGQWVIVSDVTMNGRLIFVLFVHFFDELRFFIVLRINLKGLTSFRDNPWRKFLRAKLLRDRAEKALLWDKLTLFIWALSCLRFYSLLSRLNVHNSPTKKVNWYSDSEKQTSCRHR